MVIGLLSDASTTETFLNNLSEAEFDLAEVSVLMQDAKQRAALADDVGPLKGVAVEQLIDRLVKAGLTRQQAQSYSKAIQQGQVLVAVTTSRATEAAAREMFKDHAAQLIWGTA